MKMQQRRVKPALFGVILLCVAGAAAWLISKPVPAPQSTVETPLDAAKFLNRQ